MSIASIAYKSTTKILPTTRNKPPELKKNKTHQLYSVHRRLHQVGCELRGWPVQDLWRASFSNQYDGASVDKDKDTIESFMFVHQFGVAFATNSFVHTDFRVTQNDLHIIQSEYETAATFGFSTSNPNLTKAAANTASTCNFLRISHGENSTTDRH